jgi:hypothetical protein
MVLASAAFTLNATHWLRVQVCWHPSLAAARPLTAQRFCLGLLLVGSMRHDMHLRKALPMLTKELRYALFCSFVERLLLSPRLERRDH